MRFYDTLDLLDPPPETVFGNHGIWLSMMEVKLPWQFGGQITKRTCREDSYSRETIVDEVCILRTLAAKRMAPPIGNLVFFRNVISNYPGAWHCDPLGAYGYEMANARKLPPGRFDIEAMRKLPIEGSSGAWADVVKPDNVVNGYLVDVRRTEWDMLRWKGVRFVLPDACEPASELRSRVHQECQFPAGERAEAYQDFWLSGALERGQRRVVERAELLGFAPYPGESVLDVGCQSGSFLQYAHIVGGPGRFVGVDVDLSYVDCARALARSCDQNICFRQVDVARDRDAFLAWLRAYFPGGRPDHCLTLSLEKHLGESLLFYLIDEIGAKHTYVETNAVGKENADSSSVPMKLWFEVARRGGQHVGDSNDRNLRRLYRIDR